MQQVVYVDVLVFLNTIITFLLLLAVSRLVHISPTPLHYVTGSVLGGLSSLVLLLPEMGFVFSVLSKLLFSLLIVTISYFPKSARAAVKLTGYFFAVSFIFAGMMLFAASLPGIYLVQYKNGAAYVNFSFYSLVGSCVVCYVVTAVLGKVTRHKAAGELIFFAQIVCREKTVKTTALLDTGNSLTDPFSGESVIVSDFDTLKSVVPSDVSEYLNGNQNINGIKLIPCKTVTSESLLPVFRAEEILLKSKDSTCKLQNVQIAVSRQKIGKAIVPAILIENSERRSKNAQIEK